MSCLFHVLCADSLMLLHTYNIPCHPLGVFLLTTSYCCLLLTAMMIRLVVPKFWSQRIWHKWSFLPHMFALSASIYSLPTSWAE